jgi:hypothetical protein
MQNKKSVRVLGLFLLGIFVISIFAAIVAAQGTPTTTAAGVSGDKLASAVEKTINQLTSASKPIIKLLVGFPAGAKSGELAMRFLAFLLVTIIVYSILLDTGLFGAKKPLDFIIGLIVALIGVRFLPPGFLEAMAMPSSALVALMVVVIPFVVTGYFVLKIRTGVGRKATWIVFAVLVIVLWVYNVKYNYDKLSWGIWVYPLALVAVLLALVLDGTIQRTMLKQEAVRRMSNADHALLVRSERELEQLDDEIAHLQTKYDFSKPAEVTAYERELRALNLRRNTAQANINNLIAGAAGGGRTWLTTSTIIWIIIAVVVLVGFGILVASNL